MAAGDDWDAEDLLWLAGVGFVVYAFYNAIRDMGATDQYGPIFESDGPQDPVENAVDILVPMQVSPAGISFIMAEESFSASPYADAGGQAIGYGHQILPGENFAGGISQAKGAQLLQDDLAKVARAINNSVTVPLTQNQFDALADFTYNVGTAAFQGSTLLQLLNGRDYAGAAAQFSRWNKSQGQFNQALAQRRAREQGVFGTA